MASISPNPERLQEFIEIADGERPIVMINLLKFREQAAYEADSGEAPCSGREAYARYAAIAGKKVRVVGGEPIYVGSVASCLIGPEAGEWDEALLVRYPSRQAFLRMISMPDYQAIVFHRTAALADSRLLVTDPSDGAH